MDSEGTKPVEGLNWVTFLHLGGHDLITLDTPQYKVLKTTKKNAGLLAKPAFFNVSRKN
jgi:hypothetical protein